MTSTRKQPWIQAGYILFAEAGPDGLQVEVLARRVKKSKSSFYHHFADLDVFTELLLQYHLDQAKRVAQREALCQNIVPDLIHLLLDVRHDLLFNRQLRIHHHVPAFKTCFNRTNQYLEDAFLNVWAKDLGLAGRVELARDVLSLVLDNFFLQLSATSLTYDWLRNYFGDIHRLVANLTKA